MALSKKERRRLRLEKLRRQSEEAHTSHEQRQEHHSSLREESTKSRKTHYLIGGGIAVLLLLGMSMATFSYFSPGPLDDFSKCLSGKGVKVYGALSWCEYTQGQKAMFGKSFKHLDYAEHTEYPVEEFGEIKTTPTWIISGNVVENVQDLHTLSELSGCTLP